MRKHSFSCIKAKDLTVETQPCITSLCKENSQVTPQQRHFFKNKFFMMLLKYAYSIYGKVLEKFSRHLMLDAKELLAHRTTVRNSIRINLFYYSSYQYFILDKPRYRHFLFYREKLHSLCKNITSFAITVDL